MKKETDECEDGDTGLKTAGSNRWDSIRNLRTFSSFKNPSFLLFYGFMLAMMAAGNMQMMARSLLIYRLSGSAAIIGVMALAFALPDLLVTIFGGVIADRMQKKYVLLAGQLISAVVAVGIALSLVTGYMSPERVGSWWFLIAAAVVQGIIMGLTFPARQSIIPEIVGEEQLMNAISLNMMGMNVLRLFTPAITGFLIDAFDFAAVYYTMTGLYLVSSTFMFFLPPTKKMTSHESSPLTDIKEGFQYIRRETIIILLLIFIFFAYLLAMPYMWLLPVFCDDILKVGATGMGILMSVSGAGAMVGSLALASLPNKKRGLIMLVGTVIMSVGLMCFSFSTSWSLSLAMIVFVGLGGTARWTLSNTLLMYYVDEAYRGRVISFSEMEYGLSSLGTFGAGLIAEAVGVQWAIGGFAMGLALVSAVMLAFVPRMRKLD